MTMHPLLASASNDFMRLARAHYLLVVDADWEHAQYWREAIRECEEMVCAGFGPRTSQATKDLVIRNAMQVGYEKAAKVKPYRITLGFESENRPC